MRIFLIRCNVNFESDFAAINNTKNRDNIITEWKATAMFSLSIYLQFASGLSTHLGKKYYWYWQKWLDLLCICEIYRYLINFICYFKTDLLVILQIDSA